MVPRHLNGDRGCLQRGLGWESPSKVRGWGSVCEGSWAELGLGRRVPCSEAPQARPWLQTAGAWRTPQRPGRGGCRHLDPWNTGPQGRGWGPRLGQHHLLAPSPQSPEFSLWSPWVFSAVVLEPHLRLVLALLRSVSPAPVAVYCCRLCSCHCCLLGDLEMVGSPGDI